jgi:hypothetical protein
MLARPAYAPLYTEDVVPTENSQRPPPGVVRRLLAEYRAPMRRGTGEQLPIEFIVLVRYTPRKDLSERRLRSGGKEP